MTAVEAAAQRAQDVPLYASRSRALAWRTDWFHASRGTDLEKLTQLRDRAFEHKRLLIDKVGPESGAIAGYDPAGAGSPWYPLGPRNVNGRVRSLAVHPTDPNTVYAAAAAGGVWKSSDGGQTWDPLWDMQESLALGAIGIAASAPNTLYAGTGEWSPDYGGQYGGAGVYVSTDAGGTWSRRAAVTSRRIAKLVVDPANAQRLWVAGNAGLERSTDGGVTWTTLRNDTVTDVVLDPVNSNIVYIAVRYNGFYKSTDGGNTFTLLPGAPTGVSVQWPQLAIGVSGAHTNKFLVIKMGDTVQSSIDGGTTFTAVPGGHGGFFPSWCDVIACAPDDEQIIFWGGIGLDRTANGGTTWTSLPVHADQHSVVFAPSNSNIVYVANDGGVWRSDDKGATIRKVSNGLVITQFYNIGFWSTLSNVLGGGAQDNATNYTTSGLTWKPVWVNDGGWFVIDPTDPRTMYAEGQWANLAKSVDGGNTWSAITSGVTGSTAWEGILTMDPNDHLRLYYGTNVVLRTLDGAATAWTTVSQALAGTVSAIAVAPSNSMRVYAAGGGRLYRSDDGGNSSPWADVTGTLPTRGISSIYVDPANADHLLVSIGGTSGVASAQSVYESTVGGTTWTDISGDLPSAVANSVVLDPSAATTFYAATDTGVFRTINGGTNWAPFDNGIPNVPVTDLTIDVGSRILYAATFGRGAFKLDVTPAVTKALVDLYVRDDDLDTGERIPSPGGLPDPLLPAPSQAFFWMSPDIKINHAPVYSPTGVFDGVDFDTSLVHQDLYRGQTNRFYLQVTNRGWQATTNVRVRAFVADAGAGLPNLPNALTPPNFDLTGATPWQPIGPAQTIPLLKPNRPAIVYWDYSVPATQGTHSCCLAVVSSPDDPITNAATNVGQLITQDKRVCLKNLHVVDPGPGPMPATMTTIDFHNMLDRDGEVDVVIRPTDFGRGRIGLLLPKIELVNPERSLFGVDVVPLRAGDPVGQWYHRGDEKSLELLRRRFERCDRSHLYEFDSTKVSELRGIRLARGGTLNAVLVTSHKLDMTTQAPPRYDVIQRINGQIAGASTFQVGYDSPSCDTRRQARRLRITGEHITVSKDGKRDKERIWSSVVLADDADRIYLRPLRTKPRGATVLFDGLVEDGDSLELSLVELEGRARKMERLFHARFEGAIGAWLGEHKGLGPEGLHLTYKIEDIGGDCVQPAD